MLARLAWESNGSPLAMTIAKEPVVIGTAGDIKAEFPQLARQHCRVSYDGGRFVVEHLDGATTRVNGQPIRGATVLNDGDEIQCADLRVKFAQKSNHVRPSPPPPSEGNATIARLQHEVSVLRAQLDGVSSGQASRDAENTRLRVQRDEAQAELTRMLEQLAARDTTLTSVTREAETLAGLVTEREGKLRDEQARAAAGEQETARLRAKLEQRDSDLQRVEGELAAARSRLDAVERELKSSGLQGAERDMLVADLTAQIASLNQQLDNAEASYKREVARGDGLQRDHDRIKARADEMFKETLDLRAEQAKLRLELERTSNKVTESQLERDRAQHNLARITNSLAECQHKLNDALVRDERTARELATLSELAESLREEMLEITAARERVQGLYQDLQMRHSSMDSSARRMEGDNSKLTRENANYRLEVDRLRGEVDRVMLDRITDADARNAAVVLERLRRELADANTTIIQLRTDAETFGKLRTP